MWCIYVYVWGCAQDGFRALRRGVGGPNQNRAGLNFHLSVLHKLVLSIHTDPPLLPHHRGEASPFCPYLDSLPAEDCNCLLSWSLAERAELKGVDGSVKA